MPVLRSVHDEDSVAELPHGRVEKIRFGIAAKGSARISAFHDDAPISTHRHVPPKYE
jgi:hypothetical protein